MNRLGYVAETNVSPVKYGRGLYIPEGDILHSYRRETPQILQVSSIGSLVVV
jgi:hypothetical protein